MRLCESGTHPGRLICVPHLPISFRTKPGKLPAVCIHDLSTVHDFCFNPTLIIRIAQLHAALNVVASSTSTYRYLYCRYSCQLDTVVKWSGRPSTRAVWRLPRTHAIISNAVHAQWTMQVRGNGRCIAELKGIKLDLAFRIMWPYLYQYHTTPVSIS